MIDLILYRFRIGNYGGAGGNQKKVSGAVNNAHVLNFLSIECKDNNVTDTSSKPINNAIFMIIYVYFILFFTIISFSHAISCQPNSHFSISRNIYLNSSISHITIAHIKLAYFYLISYILGRTINGKCVRSWAPKKTSRLLHLITNLILALVILNFLLIGICNPSLLNPGPNKLKVYFHNVQGLIPFSHLSDPNPKLDSTKIFELKGAGGSEVDFHFFVVSDRGECQLSGTFFRMEKYCSLPKLSHFEISKIHTFTLRARTLIAIPRKST